MTIQHEWAIEGHVLRLQWSGDVSEEEVRDLNDDLIAYLDSTTNPLVHIISDNSAIKSEPPPKFYLQQKFLKHARLGWWVSIHQSQDAGININLVGQFLKIRFRVVFSEEEAWEFLRQRDASLWIEE